ncbi:MAG: Na(+)-translocating NADH-quinone reductase subunit A [Pseudomonadota bacterium]
MIKINKGLNLPMQGEPEQIVKDTKIPRRVAVLGSDYIGLRPTMAVKENDTVKKGQLLFADKRMPGVKFTAPGAGRVAAIHRGEKRVLISLEIELSGNAEVTFDTYWEDCLCSLERGRIVEQLLDSGLWTALRARPFSKVANPDGTPHSIFINAMDSNPLAPAIDKILAGSEEDFVNGARILARLTSGSLFLCQAPGTPVPTMDIRNLVIAEFKGPHPSGNVGTHIHFLDPVHRHKTVWHIGVQDVIAVGALFTTGRLHTDRIISLAGPAVKNPRLIKTRLGASVEDLTAGELADGEKRIISGSVLSGRAASGETGFLGRYHQQISVLPEHRERELLGWLNPGLNLYSIKNVVLSKLIPGKKFAFTTSTHGEVRAILPSYNYERVMPLDIMPLFLIRALAVNDVDEAENLGCLELDEEDLALCAFVCPSKLEFGPLLRRNLTSIEEEG